MFCGGDVSRSAEEGDYILLSYHHTLTKKKTVIWVSGSKNHCSCHLCLCKPGGEV